MISIQNNSVDSALIYQPIIMYLYWKEWWYFKEMFALQFNFEFFSILWLSFELFSWKVGVNNSYNIDVWI